MSVLLGIMLACQTEDSGFSSLGNSTVDPGGVSTGQGSDTDGDFSGVNPQISFINGQFIFDEEDAASMEIHVFVVDPQDDLLNGSLDVNFGWADQNEAVQMEIDGEAVLVETGELTFVIPEVISTETYQVFVTVYDEQGNASGEANTAVAPSENE